MGTSSSVANTEGRVVALVLAAGGSTRLGQPKQLVTVAGEPLLRRTTRTVLGAHFHRVIVVVGCKAEQVGAAVQDLSIDLVINEAWHSGIASSVRCGVAAAQQEGADAVLVLPCDLPRLRTFHLNALMEGYRAGAHLLSTAWQADDGLAFGAPALLGQRYFPELLALQGDEGARKLLHLHRSDLRTVKFQDAVYDVDTPSDLDKLLSH